MQNHFTLLTLALLCASFAFASEPTPTEEDLIKQRVRASLPLEDRKGFIPVRTPSPSDWLALHPEFPQTLERYRISAPIRPTAERRTLVLQPLGNFNAEQTRMLETLRAYTEAFLQLPVRIAPPISLPMEIDGVPLTRKVPMTLRRNNYDTQLNAVEVLSRVLKPALPPDALVSVGLTAEDIFAGTSPYIHGLGLPRERVALCSLIRFFPEFWNERRTANAETQALRRACKVLAHEIGHTLGLTHCVFYECVMNGSNTLEETDEHPLLECPVCHRKLLYNLAFEPSKRFAALKDFYAQNSLSAEREALTQRLENWSRLESDTAAKRQKEE